MRSTRQKIADDLYYGLEVFVTRVSQRLGEWKAHLGVKYDAAFYDAYKNSIRPYWAQYGVKPRLAMVKSVYDVSGSLDPRYIPDDIWLQDIVAHFNDRRFTVPLADKNLNGMLFPGVKRPETLFRHMSGTFCLDDFAPISRDRALALCGTPGSWVIKPSLDSFQGRDVQFFEGSGDRESAEALLARYADTDYIVQRAVKQHPELGKFNPTSINTIRLITLVFRQEARVLSACLRVGAPGSRVDNMGAGGICFAIHPDGRMDSIACAKRNGRIVHISYEDDPLYQNVTVPCYDKVSAAAVSLAEKTPHLRLIAWDFAVDETGEPVLIEFNARSPGQNQEICGPSFGDITDEVLAEVYLGK